MDRDEEGAVREGALDHDFVDLARHAGEDLPSSEEVLAQCHELGDAVLSIPDELLQHRRDKRNGFSHVQLHPAGQPLLRERASLVQEQLGLLPGQQVHADRVQGAI